MDNPEHFTLICMLTWFDWFLGFVWNADNVNMYILRQCHWSTAAARLKCSGAMLTVGVTQVTASGIWKSPFKHDIDVKTSNHFEVLDS